MLFLHNFLASSLLCIRMNATLCYAYFCLSLILPSWNCFLQYMSVFSISDKYSVYHFFFFGNVNVRSISKCISLGSALLYSTILWGVIDPICSLSGKYFQRDTSSELPIMILKATNVVLKTAFFNTINHISCVPCNTLKSGGSMFLRTKVSMFHVPLYQTVQHYEHSL